MTQDARQQSLHRQRIEREQRAINDARTNRTAQSLQLFAGAVIATAAAAAVILAPHAGAVIATFTH